LGGEHEPAEIRVALAADGEQRVEAAALPNQVGYLVRLTRD
jgi:hypothetical protein